MGDSFGPTHAPNGEEPWPGPAPSPPSKLTDSDALELAQRERQHVLEQLRLENQKFSLGLEELGAAFREVAERCRDRGRTDPDHKSDAPSP